VFDEPAQDLIHGILAGWKTYVAAAIGPADLESRPGVLK
jgi:hypothetical protein